MLRIALHQYLKNDTPRSAQNELRRGATESARRVACGVSRGENQLGVASLREEPADLGEGGDQCLAGHGHIDVPRGLAPLGGDARGPVALDESDEATVTRAVHTAAARPVAYRRIHHETWRHLPIRRGIAVHLTDDSPRQHQIATPRKGDDPDGFSEPGRRGQVGGYTFIAFGTGGGQVE